MSYRELRNFTESLRALGYPHLISMESFRQPNFNLVANILAWMVRRYDPNSSLEADALNSEDQRVQFLKLAQQIVFTKARIRLNTKKLYSADGHAVHELLKIAQLLRRSMEKRQQQEAEQAEGEANELDDPNGSALVQKVNELRKAKSTAAGITSLGRTVHELLSLELEEREARATAVAKPLDTDTAQREINLMVRTLREEIDKLKRRMDNVDADERNLSTKIEKKKAELERARNRLQSLQSVRPAFMDEYEVLEAQLGSYFAAYLEKVRNVEYMEHELERVNREELEQYEQSKKRMMKRGRKKSHRRDYDRDSDSGSSDYSDSGSEDGSDSAYSDSEEEGSSSASGSDSSDASSVSKSEDEGSYVDDGGDPSGSWSSGSQGTSNEEDLDDVVDDPEPDSQSDDESFGSGGDDDAEHDFSEEESGGMSGGSSDGIFDDF